MERPDWITFDCYGTLVEFDLMPALLEALGERAASLDRDAFADDWERLRYEAVLRPYRPYRDVLRESLRLAMERHGLTWRGSYGDAVVEAVPSFGPFPDVPPVLARLARHARLAILTNSDDDLIAGNLDRIGVPFDQVITSEQARAYKPTFGAFNYLFRQIDSAPDRVLHVAQGFAYDVVPAHKLGLRCVWINRRGRTGDPAYTPFAELPDLTELPALVGVEPPG